MPNNKKCVFEQCYSNLNTGAISETVCKGIYCSTVVGSVVLYLARATDAVYKTRYFICVWHIDKAGMYVGRQ